MQLVIGDDVMALVLCDCLVCAVFALVLPLCGSIPQLTQEASETRIASRSRDGLS